MLSSLFLGDSGLKTTGQYSAFHTLFLCLNILVILASWWISMPTYLELATRATQSTRLLGTSLSLLLKTLPNLKYRLYHFVIDKNNLKTPWSMHTK